MTNRSLAEIIRRQQPATLPMDATVQDAGRIMRALRIGAILVTDREGWLVDLFTGRDATTRVLAEALDPATTRLCAVMTRQPDTIGVQAHAIDALRLMQDGGYRHQGRRRRAALPSLPRCRRSAAEHSPGRRIVGYHPGHRLDADDPIFDTLHARHVLGKNGHRAALLEVEQTPIQTRNAVLDRNGDPVAT